MAKNLNGKNHISVSKLSDEELAAVSEVDTDPLGEIVRRYLPAVRYMASAYPASVRDDLVQEGIIALLGAVKSFSADKNAKFSTYAAVCIKNRMLSALGRNTPISEDEADLEELVYQDEDHPEEIVIEKEKTEELYGRVESELSEMEWSVFRLFVGGMSYGQIAKILGLSEKSVDNAIRRARSKLKNIL